MEVVMKIKNAKDVQMIEMNDPGVDDHKEMIVGMEPQDLPHGKKKVISVTDQEQAVAGLAKASLAEIVIEILVIIVDPQPRLL